MDWLINMSIFCSLGRLKRSFVLAYKMWENLPWAFSRSLGLYNQQSKNPKYSVYNNIHQRKAANPHISQALYWFFFVWCKELINYQSSLQWMWRSTNQHCRTGVLNVYAKSCLYHSDLICFSLFQVPCVPMTCWWDCNQRRGIQKQRRGAIPIRNLG